MQRKWAAVEPPFPTLSLGTKSPHNGPDEVLYAKGRRDRSTCECRISVAAATSRCALLWPLEGLQPLPRLRI